MKRNNLTWMMVAALSLSGFWGCADASSNDDEAEQIRHFATSVTGVSGEPRDAGARYSVVQLSKRPGGMLRAIEFGVRSGVPGSTPGDLASLGMGLYFIDGAPSVGQFELHGDSQVNLVIGKAELRAVEGSITFTKVGAELEGTFNVTTEAPDVRVLTGKFGGPMYYDCMFEAPSGTGGIESHDGSPVTVHDPELKSEFCKANKLPRI